MRLSIISVAVLVVWALSLLATYTATRNKWQALGEASGEIHGKSQILSELCGFAAPGGLDPQADLQLDVKASSVTLTRRDGHVEIRCAQ
ncbi:hypothetical protein [Celeribacter ethanolicus]|uniref:hypothetical protein n=1 Tax=Celeribacter ethanolicus TaxID=1758178 RepID=UPI00082DC1D3|nr:hypothetical protein [Celeribacter ethanolicus]